jgi:hypothetical protein
MKPILGFALVMVNSEWVLKEPKNSDIPLLLLLLWVTVLPDMVPEKIKYLLPQLLMQTLLFILKEIDMLIQLKIESEEEDLMFIWIKQSSIKHGTQPLNGDTDMKLLLKSIMLNQ